MDFSLLPLPQKYITMISMSQEKSGRNPGIQAIPDGQEVKFKVEYDEDDERRFEVPAVRTRMDTPEAGAASTMPELQTAQMGSPEPMESGSTGQIYFIETEDRKYIKIGYSVDPIKRMSRLGTLRPGGFALRIIGWMPGSPETERWLHHKFRDHRDNGEWFRNSPALRAFIEVIGLVQPEAERSTMKKHAGAMAMVRARLKKLSPEERKEIAKNAAAARWAGHKAKRPAASRKKASK